MRTLYFILFGFIALQCNNDIELIETEADINSIEKIVLENYVPSKFPLNWPWRGINVGSADTLKVSGQTIKELRTSGVNSVHLIIEANEYSIRNNLPIEIGVNQIFNWCEKVIQWCANEGIVVIINSRDFPLDPTKNFVESSSEFWDSEVELSAALNYINQLVLNFDKYENVVAYDFFSEPVVWINGRPHNPDNWLIYFERILKTIRIHSNKYIVFTPGVGGLPAGYSDFTKPFADAKIIYGFHYYTPHSYTHQGIKEREESYSYPGLIDQKYWDINTIQEAINPAVNWAKEHNKLVYVGEFSVVRWAEGKEQYLEDVLNVFEENDLGYDYWSFKGWSGWNMDLEPIEKGSKELIKPINKTSTRQILENFWQKNNHY